MKFHERDKRQAQHAARIQSMFASIAPRYNLLNRIMTMGMDQRWRNSLVRQAEIAEKASVLDLATGTGDVAFAFQKFHPDARVVAADFALPMLREGRRLEEGHGVAWCGADALHLPFADGSFDTVASAYLLRNVTNIPATLREQLRVLRPGGRLLALDSSPPPPTIIRPAILAYLRFVIPTLGRILGGPEGANAYRYLPRSTIEFQRPSELANLFEASGLKNVRWRNFLFGTITLIWGDK